LGALTALTLFLTFDLIVFGAFTRLTDSGLGCPDWPGCYGESSPFAARDEIRQAEAALPGGPVTWSKAWIEMLHRYLAMVVGALILVLALFSTRSRPTLPHSLVWPWVTLVWVVVQGVFGKYTVTLKLYPAVVTAHLLGALLLLGLLVVQHQTYRVSARLALPVWLRRGALVALVLVVIQAALGGWVSTNYAVLACQGFPQCNGQWWPKMDFAQGFTLVRELGRAGHGGFLNFEALLAIHMVHRLMAVVVLIAVLGLSWGLLRQSEPAAKRWGFALAAALLWQIASGLGNVVLQWPIAAALAHSAGAAALVALLTALNCRARLQVVSLAPRHFSPHRSEAKPA
jgi:cytochrome c oxidase assembly protein subunit 15